MRADVGCHMKRGDLAQGHAEDLSIHPLFHEHASERLHQPTKHGVKQVDRLLSNRGVDVWAFFAYWTPFIVGARVDERLRNVEVAVGKVNQRLLTIERVVLPGGEQPSE